MISVVVHTPLNNQTHIQENLKEILVVAASQDLILWLLLLGYHVRGGPFGMVPTLGVGASGASRGHRRVPAV